MHFSQGQAKTEEGCEDEQEDREKEWDNQGKDDTKRDGWRINECIFMSLSESATRAIDY